MTNEELSQRIDSLTLETRRVRMLMEHQVLPNRRWGHHSCPACEEGRGTSERDWKIFQKEMEEKFRGE